MPTEMVANVLSGYTGRPVPYGAIFTALQQTFGPAASRKTTGEKIMGFISALSQQGHSNTGNPYGGGGMGGTGSGGGIGGVLEGFLGGGNHGGGHHHSGFGGIMESVVEGLQGGGGGGGNAGYPTGAGFGGGGFNTGGGGGGGYNAGGGSNYGGGGGFNAGGGAGFSGGGGGQFGGGTTPVRPDHSAMSREAGCLVSGCRDSETSADACPGGDRNQAFGALTHALTTTIKNNTTGRPLTNMEVVGSVRHFLAAGGFEQNPCLSCSERNAHASFII